MSEALPMFTMTLSRQIEDAPNDLSQASISLLNTVKTLCSFYNSEDLAHFVFSEPFTNLARTEQPWLVFEVGIYQDHTKIIELIPTKQEITLADSSCSGAFVENVQKTSDRNDFSTLVKKWFDLVYEKDSRYL